MKSESTSRPNPHADLYEEFVSAISAHEMTVVREDGLHRELRFSAPRTSFFRWNVVTWPGFIATHGDVANGYMSNRTDDMLEFFRSDERSVRRFDDGAPMIDFRYWAEKLTGRTIPSVKRYSDTLFLDLVRDRLEQDLDLGLEADAALREIQDPIRNACERAGVDVDSYIHARQSPGFQPSFYPTVMIDEDSIDLTAAIPEVSPAQRRARILAEAFEHAEDESTARGWLSDHEELVGSDAYWEWDLTNFEAGFIYACYALEFSARMWSQRDTAGA